MLLNLNDKLNVIVNMLSKIFTLVLVNAMIGNVYTQYLVLINMNERVCAYIDFYFHWHKAHCYNNIKKGKRTGIMRNGITI